jgi:hypothetical protein
MGSVAKSLKSKKSASVPLTTIATTVLETATEEPTFWDPAFHHYS